MISLRFAQVRPEAAGHAANEASSCATVPAECPFKGTCLVANAKSTLSGGEGLRSQFLSGWHRDDDGRNLWSTQDAAVILPNLGSKSCLSVTGLLPPSMGRAQNTLLVTCNGYPLGSIRNYSHGMLGFGFRSQIPSSSNDMLHIRFRVEDIYCPSESETGRDKRHLGFALFQASVCRPGVLRWLKAGLLNALRRLKVNLGEWLFTSFPERIEACGQKMLRSWFTVHPQDYVPGLSIVVMDAQDEAALDACLSNIKTAVKGVKEPVEVIVASERPMAAAFSSLPPGIARRWIRMRYKKIHREALRAGVDAAGHDWIYAVGSGYILNNSTLTEVQRWRAPSVFAVGSASAGTGSGWLGVRLKHGLLEFEDRTLDESACARGTLCVKEDSSLFNRRILRKIWNRGDTYGSFAWRNLEWGVRAWKMGFETIFCPSSCLEGSGKDLVSDSIASDDRRRFLLRNTLLQPEERRRAWAGKVFHGVLGDCAGPSKLRGLLSYYATRLRESGYPYDALPLEYVDATYYINPHRNQSKPNLIFVSPYVLFPPSHGSAVGMTYLLRALKQYYSIHILSDELESYGSESLPFFSDFASVRLLTGRKEDPEKLHQRIPRIESHSHSGMNVTLRMMISAYRPRFVEIEHVELAKLIDIREHPSPLWILNLHDVLLSGRAPGVSPEDRYELDLLNRFDALICCSREDAALLGRSDVTIVPNAVDLTATPYQPSPDIPRILFVGPARSAQNIPGIREFLDQVYALLLRDFANLEMWIVGGGDASPSLRACSSFRQRGVQLFGYVESIQPLLQQCALTINPIFGNRGSCRKVVESLAAGRVCVSTREGARGYLEFGFPSLLACDKMKDFVEPLRKLLGDAPYRRSLEQLDEPRRSLLSWEHAQQRFLSVYSGLEERLGHRNKERQSRAATTFPASEPC